MKTTKIKSPMSVLLSISDSEFSDEIEEYLNQHPEIDNYVIIDDDLDMLTKQMNNFVVTDTNIGMTYNTYVRAKEILNTESTYDKD